VKLATLTSNIEELKELVPMLRDLYFCTKVEILCLVSSDEESKLQANPACHRTLREYLLKPLEIGAVLKEKQILEAARNALLEERPDVILWPSNTTIKRALKPVIRQLGIGEYQLGQARETSIEVVLQNLRALDHNTKVSSPGQVTTLEFMDSHWARITPHLKSPCLLRTTPKLETQCRERFPDVDFHLEPKLDRYPCGLSLLDLSFAEKPSQNIAKMRERCHDVLSLEPVNSPLAGARYNFRYGQYDNEFALASPDFDLQSCLGDQHMTVIWDQRSGQAGPFPSPHPDGKHPAFFTTWPSQKPEWTDKFSIPKGESIKIVFADSGNVAGSVLHHAEAINRFTDSQAWAVASEPHPFIGPRVSSDQVFFTRNAPLQPELKRVLEAADCVVFFEDDDENSPNWSFPFSDYVKDLPKIHLYIGYRVHTKSPLMERVGRTLLTPLPHLLKMYPQGHFYAGFPPCLEESDSGVPPLSTSDGICRFLHTPSLPHWTTSRYPYHKDTEAYLEAAMELRKKHGNKVEFHQVGGWSHKEVIEARLSCDVTFNQLRGFHGLSGDEAMTLGRPCVQFFDQFNVNRHLEYWGLDTEFPWLSCRRQELAATFEKLLLSPALRSQKGADSRVFMRKYFSPQKGILPLLYHCYRAVRATGGR